MLVYESIGIILADSFCKITNPYDAFGTFQQEWQQHR